VFCVRCLVRDSVFGLMMFTMNFFANCTVYKRSKSLLPISIHSDVESGN
jgi:hypothetical protein